MKRLIAVRNCNTIFSGLHSLESAEIDIESCNNPELCEEFFNEDVDGSFHDFGEANYARVSIRFRFITRRERM